MNVLGQRCTSRRVGEELQRYKVSIKMVKNWWKVTLTVVNVVVVGGLVGVFHKVLIYWDFSTEPSLGLTESGSKWRKYPR